MKLLNSTEPMTCGNCLWPAKFFNSPFKIAISLESKQMNNNPVSRTRNNKQKNFEPNYQSQQFMEV